MQKLLLAAAATLALSVAPGAEMMKEKTATGLVVALDDTGRVCGLSGAGSDLLHPDAPSYLITVQEYEKKGEQWKISPKKLTPRQAALEHSSDKTKKLRLKFAGDAVVKLQVENLGRYLRFEILSAESPAGIAIINWGPFVTTLHDTIGRYLGVVRSQAFAVGALSLGCNTDASRMNAAAAFHEGDKPGAMLALDTRDHSRPVWFSHDRFISVPTDKTRLAGSAIALWGVANPSKERELDIVEEIVRQEKLPCPTIDGVWSKRSPRANESAFWVNYDDSNIDGWIKTANITGIRTLSRYNCFGNWGHFDPDPAAFKSGWDSLKMCSDKAQAHGIRTTAYTLSTFTRAFTLPERYIAPQIDPRFNHYAESATTLAQPLPGAEGVKTRDTFKYVFWADPPLPPGVADNEIRLVKNPQTFHLFAINAEVDCGKIKSLSAQTPPRRFLNIGGELVVYRTAATNDTEVILGSCERGFYGSPIKAHPAGTKVVRLDNYDRYDSLLPGSDEMIAEIALNIATAAKRGGMRSVILDGVEVTDRSGNGIYSLNHFVKTIYDNLPSENVTFVGSHMTHYTWHIFTTQSWGEHDLKRGIRGSQLEARLQHQLNLRHSNYPNKLGQYYPDSCTMEDIDWIMALAAGYDAGVDFQFALPKTYEKCERIRLWEDARHAGAFTSRQKMLMRQTDTLWSLKRENGTFALNYAGRWQGEKFEQLPSSAAPVKVLGQGTSTRPCSIDRGWAHSSGQCERWCLTDDLAMEVSTKPAVFEVSAPFSQRGGSSTAPLFIMRAPEGRKAVVNPVAHYGWKKQHKRIRVKTTLEPGEYLTIPHRVTVAFVYNQCHEMVREVNLEDLPLVPHGKGDKITVSFTADNSEPAPLLVNLRFIESSID